MGKHAKSAIECWSCGYPTMEKCDELGSRWHKCSKCGATYIKMLKLSIYPVTLKKDYAVGGKSASPRVGRKVKEGKK